jgi:hypothetical protein
MRHVAFLLAATLVSSCSPCFAQESKSSTTPDLSRHRDALGRLHHVGLDGSHVIPEKDVSLMATEIEQALRIPPTWRVLLRHAGNQDSSPTRLHAENGMLWTTLVDRSGREIAIRLMLDAQWVIVGSVLFIGPDGTSEFTRAQFRERTGFFPLHALPIVLDRLWMELEALPLSEANLRHVGLESGEPLGASPSVRCTLSFKDKTPSVRTEIELNGVIPLPAAAAHDPAFRFAGSQGVGDSVIGPVTSTKSLDRVFREARAMGRAIQSEGEWSAHIFHNNGSGSFVTLVLDQRDIGMEDRYSDFHVESSGFVDESEELSASIAGVPLTALGLRLFLTSVGAAYDPATQDIFLVLGSADRHEIDVIFTSKQDRPPTVHGASSLHLVFDAAGSKIDQVKGVVVREILRKNDPARSHWTCRFGDQRVAEVSIHKPVMCAVGVDLTSRARIGDLEYRVAGGIAETILRAD